MCWGGPGHGGEIPTPYQGLADQLEVVMHSFFSLIRA